MVYRALLQLMRTPGLPVVDSTDAPADLKGLVLFAERPNLVSVRVPSHFNWPLPMYACIYYVLGTYEYKYVVMRHQDRLFSCKLSVYFHDIQILTLPKTLLSDRPPPLQPNPVIAQTQ